MKLVRLILCLTLLLPVISLSQNKGKSLYAPVKFDVEDIVVKPEENLSRVCGNLVSAPHTSCRIDSIICIVNDVLSIAASDIDGVDFQRYFQWEDEGTIYLEIDFPVAYIPENSTIVFHTVRGNISASLVK